MDVLAKIEFMDVDKDDKPRVSYPVRNSWALLFCH
jgi:hypothetical protein